MNVYNVNARLEAERATVYGKCANCAHWSERDTLKAVGTCAVHQIKTLDLAKCTDHAEHEVHTGRILKPDEIIEE